MTRRSVFDSIYSISSEESVVTVIEQGSRYVIAIEEFSYGKEFKLSSCELSGMWNDSVQSVDLCFGEDAGFLHRPLVLNRVFLGAKPKRANVLDWIELNKSQVVLRSYLISGVSAKQLILSDIIDGKSVVYTTKFPALLKDIPSKLRPFNSLSWVQYQMERLGIHYRPTIGDPAFSSGPLFYRRLMPFNNKLDLLLLCAAKRNDVETAKLALHDGAEVNARLSSASAIFSFSTGLSRIDVGLTALMLAARYGSFAVAKLLLKDPDIKPNICLRGKFVQAEVSALDLAKKYKHTGIVGSLLNSRASETGKSDIVLEPVSRGSYLFSVGSHLLSMLFRSPWVIFMGIGLVYLAFNRCAAGNNVSYLPSFSFWRQPRGVGPDSEISSPNHSDQELIDSEDVTPT